MVQDKRILWGLGLVAGLGLGLYAVTQFSITQAQDAELASPAAPDSQSLPTPSLRLDRVGALGRLEPEGEVIEIGATTGERLGALLISKGDWVTVGTELARLESYEERLAERNFAASQLEEARIQLRAETELAQTQIEEAQTRVEQVDQPSRRQIEAQEAQVRQFEAELEDARQDLERFQQLREEGAISQQDLDDLILVVRQKEEALSSAEATLRQRQEAREQDMRNAEAQVQSAQANLTRAQSTIQIDSLTRNLELAEARLERTRIRAPREGQILEILTYPGEVIGSQGLLRMGNTRQMMVVAEVYETDIGRVELGQSAIVTSGAFPGELQGVVDQLGLEINKKDVLDTDPAADIDARVVEVWIRLDPDSSQKVASLTNLQVTVAISDN